jgi:hypothetical protein
MGVDVWSDRKLGLGGSWLAEISSAIADARAVVLLATPAALSSKWVMREVDAAQALGKLVVPLLAGGSRFGDLPASLAGINGIDLADGYEVSVRMVAEAFASGVEPGTAIEVPRAALPVLLLLTDDESVAALVVEVSRPVGLVVMRLDPLSAELLEVVACAHVVVIDGRMSVECGFVAGYTVGRNGRVICVDEAAGWRVPSGAGIRFCQLDAAELEREICVAAFLPVRQPA